VLSSSQPVPTRARGVVREARRRDNCPAYVLPRVRELPLLLEPVVVDCFGGLIASHPAACAGTTTINHPRRALS
jgi:hypothetical protein